MAQALVEYQTTMGWSNFIQGKIIKDWVGVFNEERQDERNKDDGQIIVKFIKLITSFTLNLCRSMCSQVFGVTHIQRITKKQERTLAQVKDLIKDQSVLTQNWKYHIDGAPEDNTILCNILAWIRLHPSVLHYRQVMKNQKVKSTNR